MGCCCCFGLFSRKPKKRTGTNSGLGNYTSQVSLLDKEGEDDDYGSYNGYMTDAENADDCEFQSPTKRSEEILMYRMQHGLICREYPVKETNELIRSEDENGNKMVNEYVREYKIGAGSYGKVVLYRSQLDGKHYAIKSSGNCDLGQIFTTQKNTH